jgi:PGF-CTERM protein
MPTSTEATTDPPATSDEPQLANDAASANAEQSTETNAPGFGIGAAIVAMAGTALVASRRRS